MAKINERIKWSTDVYQISRGDNVEGGRGGVANMQAQQLAGRTLYLKAIIESFKDQAEKTFYRTDGDRDGTVAGIDGTKSGEIFRVAQGDGEDNAFIYYLNESGVATVIARVNAMNRVMPTNNDAFLFKAENGVVAAIMPDGTLRVIAVKADELTTTKFDADSVASKSISLHGNSIRKGKYPFSLSADNGDILVVDNTGKLFGIECDFGKIRINGVDIQEIFGVAAKTEIKRFKIGFISGFIHSGFYGQSQVIGTTNGVIHGTAADQNSLMLTGGLRSYGTPGYNTSVTENDYSSSLVAMHEHPSGETYCSGMSITARAYINLAYQSRDIKNIYTVNGAGGATVDMLKRGTNPYLRWVRQTVDLISLLSSMGEAYHCPTICWSQGGSDDGLATNPDDWESAVDKLRTDYNADILARTGVKIEPIWITNQINNYMRYPAIKGKPNIGLRQYEMVTNGKGIYAGACPTYICDFIDVAHWTKESQVKIGAYYEKTRRFILEDGYWEPVYPILITTTGKFSSAQFHLPQGGKLQFNTTDVRESTNYGFSAAQADGTPIGIDRVRLVSDDTVEVRYIDLPLSGAVLMYGQTGQVGDPNAADGSGLGRTHGMRGNLCDTAGDNEKIYVSASEPEYPLHNWAWMFTESMGVYYGA